jgi:UDP-N-acetyl-2-amino-2-deoxyglucuronate dehydrogenase
MADFMEWCVGRVDSVSASLDTRTKGIDVPDHVVAVFRFENGATGVLELSWTMPFGAGLLEIYGTAGRIRMGFSKKPIELVTVENGIETTTYPEPSAGVPTSHQAFADAIRGKAPTRTPATVGRNAVALCEAIVASGETGKFAKVKRGVR